MPQRYYDPCGSLSNPQRAEQQAAALRALADAELVSLGEPCTLECLAGAAKCATCREAAGVALPAEWPACDEAAQQRAAAQRHVVPWLQQPQQGEVEGKQQQEQQQAEGAAGSKAAAQAAGGTGSATAGAAGTGSEAVGEASAGGSGVTAAS